jgi:hypothetical protein
MPSACEHAGRHADQKTARHTSERHGLAFPAAPHDQGPRPPPTGFPESLVQHAGGRRCPQAVARFAHAHPYSLLTPRNIVAFCLHATRPSASVHFGRSPGRAHSPTARREPQGASADIPRVLSMRRPWSLADCGTRLPPQDEVISDRQNFRLSGFRPSGLAFFRIRGQGPWIAVSMDC